MKKSYLILNELENVLRYWEDLNLFGSVIFRLQTQKQNPLVEAVIKAAGIWTPIQGTELNEKGFLVRDIKNYKGLRAALEHDFSVGIDDFLPRVPAPARGVIEKLELSRSNLRTRPVMLFPYSILRWAEYKKVYSLENTELVPRLPLNEQNHLARMPFPAFMLRFEDGIAFNLPESNITKEFMGCICSLNGNMLDVFCLPINADEYCMDKETRDFFSALANGKKFDLKLFKQKGMMLTKFDPGIETHSFLKASFNILTGHCLFEKNFSLSEKDKGTSWYWDLYTEPMRMYTDDHDGLTWKETMDAAIPQKDFIILMKHIVELVNGFCYTLSTLHSGEKAIVMPGKPAPEQEPRNPDYGWNAIPITQTQFLKPSDDSLHPRLVMSTGKEKSPHYRRGHERTIINEDGTSRTIWIKETLVREDKLESEKLQGNVVKIKEKQRT